MPNFLTRLLSFGADKELRRFQKMAERINELEPTYVAMSEDELKACTPAFRERLDRGESLDDILFEAFAAMREASRRTLGLRHFDVQLVGGIALHSGMIAEMKTGEGKTIVANLAGYLNALGGEGVHIVTVNDYLAKRDSEQMSRPYGALGMTVGLLQNGMRINEKRPAYNADITYGTNTEFGFDYLRDNMVSRAEDRMQRGHAFAVVDEVDSILIDEARTPLIISGAGTRSGEAYQKFARAVKGLREGVDFEMDEAKHTIAATEVGLRKVEELTGIDNIYDDMSGQLVNHLQQALKAQFMYHKDKDYMIQDGEIKIVDEFTGRAMEGRRWSEGLHQAVEAKEGLLVREENQTLATITLQNYFRLYKKLSGMTGTALTEDAEFREIYKLPVQPIPPNKPVIRIDNDDLVYRTVDTKFSAVVEDVIERHAKGQPVLVGTVAIESSEKLSRMLDKRGIKHEVLNAKHHEREAAIVAQAGRKGAVTIATNMAGRGTDILLGGNPEFLALDIMRDRGIDPDEADEVYHKAALEEARAICASERKDVVAAGGLCVIGTERHESRRIDNQLRGRSGRQGDPGETQFYLSLEDDLMRLFGGDRMDSISALMHRMNMPEDMPIQAKLITKSVESAQRKVEDLNFSARKHVLEYDDVMNKQRTVIYNERNQILDGKDLSEHIDEVMHDTVENEVANYASGAIEAEDWDAAGLESWVQQLTGKDTFKADESFATEDPTEVTDAVYNFVKDTYQAKTEALGEKVTSMLERQVMLRVIDTRWMNYLQEMDYLKQGIGLRGYGQRDPLVEYKEEAYRAFGGLVSAMYEDFLRTVLRIELANPQQVSPQAMPQSASPLAGAHFSGPAEVDGDAGNSTLRSAMRNNKAVQAAAAGAGAVNAAGAAEAAGGKARTYIAAEHDPYAGVGRNDKCPCGSGKKFKNCHGRNV
ncbi:MAG: preprotein translocase subunit SecA [Coriobacteriales bacterium]|nr:preprotein translocase subunit SecA [Coriobacteriales bacterium]